MQPTQRAFDAPTFALCSVSDCRLRNKQSLIEMLRLTEVLHALFVTANRAFVKFMVMRLLVDHKKRIYGILFRNKAITIAKHGYPIDELWNDDWRAWLWFRKPYVILRYEKP